MTSQMVPLSTLTETIAEALALHPADRGRIERAATLIALGAVTNANDPAAYWVRSQSDPTITYTVTPDGCPCVDAERHPGQWCKHQFAARIVAAAEMATERERARATEYRDIHLASCRYRRQGLVCSTCDEVTERAERVALAYARSTRFAA